MNVGHTVVACAAGLLIAIVSVKHNWSISKTAVYAAFSGVLVSSLFDLMLRLLN